jgi:hypothetical protein
MRNLVITPDEHPLFYAIKDRILQRSADRGATWTSLPIPTERDGRPAYPLAFTIDYRHPEVQYLATTAGVFQREGQGEWQLRNSIKATSLAVDFVDSNVLWAGVYWDTANRAVVMRSNDAGGSWAKADIGISAGYHSSVDTILVDPNDPHTLYAVERDSGRFGWPSGRLYRGTRQGQWHPLSLGPFERSYPNKTPSCSPNSLAFDPVGDALYVGCDAYYYNGGHAWLLRTRQPRALDPQTIPWEVVHEFEPTGGYWFGYARPLAVDARAPWSLYVETVNYVKAAQHHRLWVSHDQGQSWR